MRSWLSVDLRASLYLYFLYSAALLYFYAPHHHFAFLISNFSFKRGFQPLSKDSTPHGLTLSQFLISHKKGDVK